MVWFVIDLIQTAQYIYKNDPAIRSRFELLLYPGLWAILLFRIAHFLHILHVPIIPKLLAMINRWLTGIEIHPAAKIGKCLFIDHGVGVIIGETSIIGDNCLIYQGATLHGTGNVSGKRHPTLGNNVVLGAGCTIIGNIYLGDWCRVGAGSIVTQSLPANCTAVGVPAKVVKINGVNSPKSKLDQQQLPQLMDHMCREVRKIQNAMSENGMGLELSPEKSDQCMSQFEVISPVLQKKLLE
uniref:serine O-acetyltransferase n=1 Tax=Trepomonas sp. PC1 TaxID=1076344 RepID=A0A146K6W2_9EUKA|eukprot:JAP92367.1 Serine acetyltransferase [Trepomonas sp. PC1]